MPKTYRHPLAALMALLLLMMAAPAGADTLSSTRRARDSAHARRTQLASQIDALKATDTQLAAAVNGLTKQVGAQAAAVDTARLGLRSAIDAVDQANARLGATHSRIGSLHTAVVHAAVLAYVRPTTNLNTLIGSHDLTDASRRQLLLSQVNERNVDVLDQLHAARQDLTIQQGALAKAQALASARRRLAEARLADLGTTLAAKDQAQSALAARIKAYQAEDDHIAAQEESLSALIRQRQLAAVTASRGGIGLPVGRISGAGLIWPVNGPINSPFGPRWGRFHTGIDIGAGYGTPIRAAKSGQVIHVGWMGGYGNVVVIDHGGGFSTLYAHQSAFASADGENVGQGQVIGYVCATGDATGPHLHLETRVDGTPQDPMRYLP